MDISRISDLDELALSVRDLNSKSYIVEAISAYRVGAFRSSIMSTWIAVAYDIIAKIRELSDQGNGEAIVLIQELYTSIENRNISKLQKLEEGILEKAFSIFGFISSNELIDLQRLKDDRNLCAHPAFVSEGQLYQPTPELVRTHIVHAVLHLLRHMPVQGKEALERIKKDLVQPSFPQDKDNILKFMNEKYLRRARPSLVTGLIDLLLKIFLKRNVPELSGKEYIIANTLIAISNTHPMLYDQQSLETLNKIVDSLEDNQLFNLIPLIRIDDRYWGWIGETSRIRIVSLIKTVNSRNIMGNSRGYEVFELLDIPGIRQALLNIFEKMDPTEQIHVISRIPRVEFTDKAIDLFGEAKSFKQAEALGRSLILPMLPFFSSENIIRILRVSRENSQIWSAYQIKPMLIALFDQTIHYFDLTKGEWKQFIEYVLGIRFPDDYYAYPEIQQRLSDRGVDFKTILADMFSEESEGDD